MIPAYPKPQTKKRRKRKYKSSRHVQIERMDEKFAIYIKLRDGLQCRRCGAQFQLTDNFKIPPGCQNSHYIGRTKKNTRWDPANCFTHCTGCHFYLGNNPELFRRWVLEKGGHTPETLEILFQKSEVIFRSDLNMIELVIDSFLSELLARYPRLNYKVLEGIYVVDEFLKNEPVPR